jgi:tripartite-type tricarboxylate transporter receptor subunit TctC
VIAAPAAAADAYPTKPINFIVPYPPGGGNDDVARLLARKIEQSLGQPVIVENKAGASGMIAGAFVSRAVPDGYTVMIDHSGIVMNPALYPKVTYDVQRDLAPITLAVSQGNILLSNPSLPVRSVSELIALAKAQPGKLNYASPGNGTPQHIGMEMFNRMAGVDIVHIPYKGGAPATVALIAGEVQLLLSGTTGLPHVKTGKARALATTGTSRSGALPEVPTVNEAGLKGYVNTNWLGIFAPANTPAPVIARLNQEFVKALRAPDVQKLLAERNYDVVASTPQEFARVIEQGLREYGKLIRDANIKPD